MMQNGLVEAMKIVQTLQNFMNQLYLNQKILLIIYGITSSTEAKHIQPKLLVKARKPGHIGMNFILNLFH